MKHFLISNFCVIFSIAFLLSGCEKTNNDEPDNNTTYLSGDYYGEVVYNTPLTSQHKYDVKAKATVAEQYGSAWVVFYLDNYSPEVRMDFDLNSNRGEIDKTNEGQGISYKGFMIIDGVTTRGEYRTYDLDNNGELLSTIVWHCYK